MKHLKSISSGIQSAAKLTILFIFWTCTLIAADTSPFATIAGAWDCHMSSGQDRIYTIAEDGTVSFKDSQEARQGKLSVIDGQFAAEFDDRWQVFYKTSENVLKIESFNPKSRFAKKEPNATGTGHRAPAPVLSSPPASVASSQAQDVATLAGNWNVRFENGVGRVYRIAPDGTYISIGVEGRSEGKVLTENGQLIIRYTDGRVQRLTKLADTLLKVEAFADANAYAQGRVRTTGSGTLEKPAPVAGVTPSPAPGVPPPVATELRPVIHSLEELLAGVDTTKPLKPYDRVDFDIIHQMDNELRVNEGREIEIEIQPTRAPSRISETQFRWQLAPVKSGTSAITPALTVTVYRDDVATAVAIVPGKSAILHGVIQRCTVGYSNGPMLYVTIQESSLKAKAAESVAVANPPSGVQQPASSVTTPQPVPEEKKSIQLDKGWDTPMQGGSQTLNDLARLFGPLTKANADFTAPIDAPIYDQITYLMPARQAIESLKLNVRVPSKVLIACPGFPHGSLYYYAIDSRFEGYNRMYLVVDRADQVISMELVDETPSKPTPRGKADSSWHTYDFVNARSRASNTLCVEHRIALWTSNSFEESHRSSAVAPDITAKNAGWRIARVDSTLVQVDKYGYPTTAKQQTRWYVPRPLMELILTCVQKTGK